MKPTAALGWIFVALLAAGCSGANQFMKASASFADATSAGAASFAPEFDTASTLCRRRARLDFLQKRLQPGARWGSSPYWSEWYAQQPINPANPQSETWKSHCDQIEQVESVYRRALELLAAYAAALHDLGASGSYSGCDVRNIAAETSSLARSLKLPGALGDAIAGIGDPLTAIANFLIEARTVKEMRQSVAKVNPTIQTVLTDLGAYARSTEAELRDAEARVGELLVTMDIRMANFTPTVRALYNALKASTGKGDGHPASDPQIALLLKGLEDEMKKSTPVDPVHAVAFYQFAAAAEDELRALRNSQDSYKQVLEDLGHAHDALSSAAAHSGDVSLDDLKRALGFTSAVLRETANIKGYLNQRD